MRLFTTITALRFYLDSYKNNGNFSQTKIGFVPTMGALHQGHLSLIERAKKENQVVVVSIFVNPLQFGPQEDFQSYPRQLESDSQFCQQAGVDVLFVPSPELLGISGDQNPLTTVIPPTAMTSVLCGQFRPGHFTGVATIVAKLLNIVKPTRAYFGEKDAQQLAIIRKLVIDLNLPSDIMGCAIIREKSGLALSSRNQYLTAEERAEAAILYQGLQAAQDHFVKGERTSQNLINIVKNVITTGSKIKLEYVELVDPDSLMPLVEIRTNGLLALAARLGKARLIDNIILRNRKPIVSIDGPAGAGKSTVTKLVAEKLGLTYLDTGAMYRAVTWLVLQSKIDLEDQAGIAELISQCQINFINNQGTTPQILINGQNVTQAIRSSEVTATVSRIAAQQVVRQILVKQQQQIGHTGGLIAEGRDIGTFVFPDAELKIFLTASVEERAKRRLLELQQKGENNLTMAQVKQDISSRDEQDMNREIAPLCKAIDAIEIITDGLTITEVIDQIIALYESKISDHA